MKKYYSQAKTLALSKTARDTYVLFGGNVISAFLAFIFTLFTARNLSVSDFGVFSAINNLIAIIGSVSDFGISAGLMKFISTYEAKGQKEKAKEVLKAALILRLFTLAIFIIGLFVFPKLVANKLLATQDTSLVYWTAILSFGIMIWHFFPTVFQAYKRFLASVGIDVSLGITRILFIILFIFLGTLTIQKVLLSFTLGSLFAGGVALSMLGFGFLKKKVSKKLYVKILKFSGWVGVNRAVSAFSGRLDVQMLAVLTGATVTGHYSISSRLALFIVMLTSSFSAVLAPRLSSFTNKDQVKKYLLKASFALVPMVLGIIFWIIIAKPFIVILFGEKYLPSVPIFKALAAAMIPFIITAPSVTAIIYAMKKPIYIGAFSFFQLLAILVINLLLIPKIGAYAPTIAFAFVHTVLAIYTWAIVYKFYWR